MTIVTEIEKYKDVDLRFSLASEKDDFEDILVTDSKLSIGSLKRILLIKNNDLFTMHQDLLNQFSIKGVLIGQGGVFIKDGEELPGFQIPTSIRPLEYERLTEETSRLGLGADYLCEEIGEIAAEIDKYKGKSGDKWFVRKQNFFNSLVIDDFLDPEEKALYVSPTIITKLESTQGGDFYQYSEVTKFFENDLLNRLIAMSYREHILE